MDRIPAGCLTPVATVDSLDDALDPHVTRGQLGELILELFDIDLSRHRDRGAGDSVIMIAMLVVHMRLRRRPVEWRIYEQLVEPGRVLVRRGHADLRAWRERP